MAFSQLSYSPGSSMSHLGPSQSPPSNSSSEPLSNLLSYSSNLPAPQSDSNHLVNLYNPAYAAVQNHRFLPPLNNNSSSSVSPTVSVANPNLPNLCVPPSTQTMNLGMGMSPSCHPPGIMDPSLYSGLSSNSIGYYNPGAAWRPGPPGSHLGAPHPQTNYPYDHSGWHPYSYPGGHGLDLNGARRKNATRESTATLKAWLQEHIKNPYPTKGEKIMLAIITKMTLTQVSTWFANARRRLKKENKMTWSPRNRTDDGDMDGSSHDDSDLMEDIDVKSEAKVQDNASVSGSHNRLEDCDKPKIWSLAMTATSAGSFMQNNNSIMNNSTSISTVDMPSLQPMPNPNNSLSNHLHQIPQRNSFHHPPLSESETHQNSHYHMGTNLTSLS